MFTHTTSSPYHPQSNGKAENAVKTVKRLFTKCQKSDQSEFLALLDWRNTPTEGVGTSPAQRLVGRRCKTLLPVAGTLLTPNYPTEEDTRAIMGKRERQQYYYNRHAKPLQPLIAGETVRIRPPGEKSWIAGTCIGQAGPRSYNVRVGEAVYRRNRRDLIISGEPPIVDIPDSSAQPATPQPEMPAISPSSSIPQPPPQPAQPSLRRSQRQRQPPARLKDYV